MAATITIAYLGQDYVVPLTASASEFFVKSVSGAPLTVDAATAANLFGAEQAVQLLTNLHTKAGIDRVPADWNAVLAADRDILGTQVIEKALAAGSGLILSGVVTKGASVGEASVLSLADLVAGSGPAMVDLALVAAFVNNAKARLAKASSVYWNSIAGVSGPIDYGTIAGALADTLLALNVGATATSLARSVPGVSNTWADDIRQIFTSFAGPLTSAIGAANGVFATIGAQFAPKVL